MHNREAILNGRIVNINVIDRYCEAMLASGKPLRFNGERFVYRNVRVEMNHMPDPRNSGASIWCGAQRLWVGSLCGLNSLYTCGQLTAQRGD